MVPNLKHVRFMSGNFNWATLNYHAKFRKVRGLTFDVVWHSLGYATQHCERSDQFLFIVVPRSGNSKPPPHVQTVGLGEPQKRLTSAFVMSSVKVLTWSGNGRQHDEKLGLAKLHLRRLFHAPDG